MTSRPRGVPLPPLTPGSPAWYRSMSASKVPAVLGLSKWKSPFSLWHMMAGNIPPEPSTDLTRRGHYLEPAVAAWFAAQHEDYEVLGGGAWGHPQFQWYTASPDRLLSSKDSGEVSALLELKSEGDLDAGWGEPGTDEIPPAYRAQVVAQMDVVGVDVAYIAVLLPFLEFAEYTVRYDPDEATLIRGRCADFMDSLARGDAPPIDGHSATYAAIRELHPDIADEDVDVPDDIARHWCKAHAAKRDADTALVAARNALADVMGDARRALWDGSPIATRRARTGGRPYITAARQLPNPTVKDVA